VREGSSEGAGRGKPRRLNAKLETLPVNRPLDAFGFLIGGLALAMFAVSSTSRSTGVQKLAVVNHHVMLSQSVRGMKVQPISAAATADSMESTPASALIDDGPCDPDSFDLESRGVEYRLENLRPTSGQRSEMKSVRLQVAERTVLSDRSKVAVDCRSHYDRVYDKLVYGEADLDVALRPMSVATESRPISAVEVSVIFRGLLEGPRSAPARPATADNKSNQKLTSGPSINAQLRGFVTTLGSWLAQWTTLRVEMLVGPELSATRSQSLSWAEYSDLIDRAAGGPAAKFVAAPTSGGSASVRSSGWLRHSAAATLYQLGLMLKEAGVEIERASGR
jgi:hypothetical protein